MKFQKTLLALSLSVFAVTATHAVEAQPVQKTEGLFDSATNEYVYAPVAGGWDRALNNPLAPYTNFSVNMDAINPVFDSVTGDLIHVDFGSKTLTGLGANGQPLDFDVFKYTATNSPTTEIYQFQNPTTGEKTGYFTRDLTTSQLVNFTGDVDLTTLQKGGKVAGTTGNTFNSGYETKVANSEHVLYGYQGQNSVGSDDINGRLINEDGTEAETLAGSIKPGSTAAGVVKYVQNGIIANEYTKGSKDVNGNWIYDPANNIYGVSARNSNNIVTMTGDGIALGDLKNNGKLQFDGSVVSNARQTVVEASGIQKTRQYNTTNGSFLEIYNDDAGRELESQWFQVTGNGNLTQVTNPNLAAGSHDKTGVGTFNKGTFEVASTKNTVTNQSVTYGEQISSQNKTEVTAGVTITSAQQDTTIRQDFENGPAETIRSHSVSTGILSKDAEDNNVYGLQVKRTENDKPTQTTTVTAAGVTTSGFIDAADYRIGGVSISQSFNDAVNAAQDAAGTVKVEAVQEAKVYTDTKSSETLAAANTAAAEADKVVLAESKAYTNTMIEQSGMNRVTKRLNDVEQTANRGVAIALAASQPMPNIKPGQVAVFGGVGHYEGENAISMGAGTMLADGRTSISGAFGFAGSEIGGRVGLSYTFGQ